MNPGTDAYLGSHQLIRKIGRGGMAEIYLARKLGQGGFQRRVVVKCLHDHLCGNPEAENRFLEEAVIGGLFEHGNIVRVTDVARAGGRLYMILDYVQGVDLRGLLSSVGALPLTVVLHLGRELARGLHYVHTLADATARPLELVHRDISPSNILLSEQGEVKLTDFGVAKALGRTETRGGVVKGKYGYMSPEQVQQHALDAASDQFSLAVVLLEALTGTPVFVGSGPLQIMEQILEGCTPQIPAEGTAALPDLDPMLARMLARHPRDRFANMAQVGRILSEMLARLRVHNPERALAELVIAAGEAHSRGRVLTSDTQSATLEGLALSGQPDSETDHYGAPLKASSQTPRPDDDTSQYRISQRDSPMKAALASDEP